jgi:hypothetical protein
LRIDRASAPYSRRLAGSISSDLRSAASASSGFSCFSYTFASAIQPRGSSGLCSVIQRAMPSPASSWLASR